MTDFPVPRDRSDWTESAACRQHDPELWHPEPPIGGRSHSRHARVAEIKEMTTAALNICAGCPVRQPCLDEALAAERDTPGIYGIFGGLLAEQRAAIIRKGRADVA